MSTPAGMTMMISSTALAPNTREMRVEYRPREAPSRGTMTGRLTREIITGAIPQPIEIMRSSTARSSRRCSGLRLRPRGIVRALPRVSPTGRKMPTMTVAAAVVTA